MDTKNKDLPPLPPLPLPDDITEDYIDCTSSCGLTFHILKSGDPKNPLVLFTHGYPELAYSWRKILPSVAEAGFFCVAPDQRGYGRTTGWSPEASYDETDLTDFTLTNLVRDLVCLVQTLGYSQVRSIIGHDFGAVTSAAAALIRPDIFESAVQMSHPYHPPPSLPSATTTTTTTTDIHAELSNLNPPRKHYKHYHSSPRAASDYADPLQGLEEFLRGYFHLNSADWAGNSPRPLKSWTAGELAVMPEYYVMREEQSMPDAVRDNMRGEELGRTERWLGREDLAVYCAEWRRTGFQGALSWYRAQSGQGGKKVVGDMWLFSGRRLEVPVVFISGEKDWGNYQVPGALEGYEDEKLVKKGMFRGVKMVEGAGHWVQQEQPERVAEEVLEFLKSLG
ncbi:Alpha/Beta hydrolase protein [Cladorrhinum samala]|uniref:Alpha/Beta hydrolase protein n=1 Tax=Cladorrhinum samala TaxID=585594 RepID=A0AAV9HT93_9PEZI|nr:Alpha/Beta hydrolase protein [Cladorrhinum samala]